MDYFRRRSFLIWRRAKHLSNKLHLIVTSCYRRPCPEFSAAPWPLPRRVVQLCRSREGGRHRCRDRLHWARLEVAGLWIRKDKCRGGAVEEDDRNWMISLHECRLCSRGTRKWVQAVILLPRIRKVRGWNLGRGKDHPDRGCRMFSQSSKFRCSTTNNVVFSHFHITSNLLFVINIAIPCYIVMICLPDF